MSLLVVSDFDGTLVDSEERIPYSTVGMIDKLRRKGVKFVVATGRCFKSIFDYNRDFIFIDYIVSSNGGYIYDVVKDRVVYKKNILISNAKKIISKYYNQAIIYVIDHNTWHLLSKESAYQDDFDVIKENDYENFLSENKNNIYKIELYFKTLKKAKLALKEINELGLKINANLQIDEDKYIIEVTHQDVNKLEGMKKIVNLEKKSLEDVLAFGDGYNDLDLLKEVGCGVAVSNAVAEVKKIADDITLDHDHKGVEIYLKKYFGSR